jgi:chromosome segregation ATPase
MTDKRQPKTRIPAHDNEQLKQALGDTTINDFIAGAIYDFLEGDLEEEYYEQIAELHEIKGEKSEIDGQIDSIDDRIDELEAERERLAEERDAKQERIDELEEELADTSETESNSDAGRSSVEDVAYDVLVEIAHRRAGSNGITAGDSEVREAARRANVHQDDVIAEMREQSAPAGDALGEEDIVERSMLLEDEIQERKRERPDSEVFDWLREEIAEEVLDESDVDWDAVPERDDIFRE